VLKEAYLKALGTGMHRGLDGFSFAPSAPYGADGARRITVHDPDQPGPAGDGWWFDVLHPGPEHVLALAVEGANPGVLSRTDLSGI
jgi:4'-phosphopantetheinyl transferase